MEKTERVSYFNFSSSYDLTVASVALPDGRAVVGVAVKNPCDFPHRSRAREIALGRARKGASIALGGDEPGMKLVGLTEGGRLRRVITELRTMEAEGRTREHAIWHLHDAVGLVLKGHVRSSQ
jgi:hypothetical protein